MNTFEGALDDLQPDKKRQLELNKNLTRRIRKIGAPAMMDEIDFPEG